MPEPARPRRIQLSRAKGWRLPPGAVKVDRSTKWGNPFRADRPPPEEIAQLSCTAADAFRWWLEGGVLGHYHPERRQAILDGLGDLRGRDLACWCRPGADCHADVLLELANA
jgi:hypothetical protein